jgi:transcription antitermination factor NusG
MLASKKNINGTDGAKLYPGLNNLWHVVYTKPRSEKKVLERFQEADFEAYCPLQKVKKVWTDRKKWIEEPIFKSYCFVKINTNQFQEIREIQGVVNFVYWLKKPAIIRDEEIEELKNLFSKHAIKSVSLRDIKVNQEIIIKRGILSREKGVVKKIFKNTITVEIRALNIKVSLHKSDLGD